MTCRTSAIATASVVEGDAEIQRDVEDRLLFPMIFVRQLAVLESDGLAFGQECYLHGVLARSFLGNCSGALCFLFSHCCSCHSGEDALSSRQPAGGRR